MLLGGSLMSISGVCAAAPLMSSDHTRHSTRPKQITANQFFLPPLRHSPPLPSLISFTSPTCFLLSSGCLAHIMLKPFCLPLYKYIESHEKILLNLVVRIQFHWDMFLLLSRFLITIFVETNRKYSPSRLNPSLSLIFRIDQKVSVM